MYIYRDLNTVNMKICAKCKIDKDNSEFYIVNSYGRTYMYPRCKDCAKQDNANRKLREGYRQKENDRNRVKREADPEWSTKERIRMAKFNSDHPSAHMFYNAKRRAKKNGLEFSIEMSDIVIPSHCPYLGIPIITGTRYEYESTPSLDRVDNTRGYTKDNILVVSKKGNSMKNSATFQELQIFCTNIMNLLIDKDIVQSITNVEVVEV